MVVNKPSRRKRKWFLNIGTLCSAMGIAFLTVEEFRSYKTVAVLVLIIGCGLLAASNIYREKKDKR